MPTVWFIQSQQPTTNPTRLPKARSEYTYQPPARGSMVASSFTAPLHSSVYTPPTSQIAEVSPAVPMYPATSPGVRRMPPPIVLPTPPAIPKPTPSIRSSRPPRRPVSEMYAGVVICVVAVAAPAPNLIRRSRRGTDSVHARWLPGEQWQVQPECPLLHF